MGDTITGILFAVAGVLAIWFGIRRRRSAGKGYADDVRRYSASTTMTVVHINEDTLETWEDDKLRREKVYLPTYEYMVDGKTYRYFSRQSLSSKRELGRQIIGYYDPSNPEHIMEDRPRRPVFAGFFFFLWAAFLLLFAYLILAGQVSSV